MWRLVTRSLRYGLVCEQHIENDGGVKQIKHEAIAESDVATSYLTSAH